MNSCPQFCCNNSAVQRMLKANTFNNKGYQVGKLKTDEKGFSAVEVVLVLVIVVLIGAVGFLVYKNQHKTKTASVATTAAAKPITTPTKTATPTQKYVTVSAWGVRVPYSGSDTLSVGSQTCTENGDASGDTVNLGCSVTVSSQALANSVGSCQSSKATGTVGYFYKMGANDNYSETSGAGFEPVAQWTAANPGQYTQIGGYTYAFAEIGAAWGGQGTDVIKTSTNALADTTPAGCDNWIAEYNSVEPTIKALAAKFEAAQ
jgi:hypothetical protein